MFQPPIVPADLLLHSQHFLGVVNGCHEAAEINYVKLRSVFDLIENLY